MCHKLGMRKEGNERKWNKSEKRGQMEGEI
jgi:hypothetical protein